MTRHHSADYRSLNHSANPHLIKACERKAGYGSEQAARRIARDVIRHENSSTQERLWVYACAHCRKFHLTKVENKGAAITAHEMYEGTGM
jgi:hypothetical protein